MRNKIVLQIRNQRRRRKQIQIAKWLEELKDLRKSVSRRDQANLRIYDE